MTRKQILIVVFIVLAAASGLAVFSAPAQVDATRSPQTAPTPTPTINPLDYVCATQTSEGVEICAEPAGGLTAPELPLPNQQSNSDSIQIYFFWGDGCPHCAEEEIYLADALERLPISINSFETWYDAHNKQLYERMADAYGFQANYVPATFIGDKYWIGFNEEIQAEIEQTLQTYAAGDLAQVPDAARGVLLRQNGRFNLDPDYSGPLAQPTQQQRNTLTLPILGTINLAEQSIVASTALIAFVDGFNPCSVWVLSVLLALTLHTGSRKKVLIIGFTFITVTAAIYAIFIAGIFTILTFVSFIKWIQIVIALMALFFGLVNIKDYFWYKEGLSFTISESDKPGIYKSMRRVINASGNLWGLVTATIVLAAGVSLVEFSCTAGFPVLWSNLLVSQNVPSSEFIWLILLYMFIYQIDELFFFGVAVVTLRASKLEEKHGRLLKLFSGMLMLSLSLVMIINPELMNELSSALIIFGGAVGATILITLIHQQVLPRLGIKIGTQSK
jgi:glutaredoxin